MVREQNVWICDLEGGKMALGKTLKQGRGHWTKTKVARWIRMENKISKRYETAQYSREHQTIAISQA